MTIPINRRDELRVFTVAGKQYFWMTNDDGKLQAYPYEGSGLQAVSEIAMP